ncbi:MAG TPA: hypothetical protein VF614_02265 [Chthoniobacteraceae bacterium]|jgi:hypothetical protein
MTAAYQKELRKNLLRQLRAASRFGLNLEELHLGAKVQGFEVTKSQVEAEIEHLMRPSLGHVEEVDQEISPELKYYTLAEPGREWLKRQGL